MYPSKTVLYIRQDFCINIVDEEYILTPESQDMHFFYQLKNIDVQPLKYFVTKIKKNPKFVWSRKRNRLKCDRTA